MYNELSRLGFDKKDMLYFDDDEKNVDSANNF